MAWDRQAVNHILDESTYYTKLSCTIQKKMLTSFYKSIIAVWFREVFVVSLLPSSARIICDNTVQILEPFRYFQTKE